MFPHQSWLWMDRRTLEWSSLSRLPSALRPHLYYYLRLCQSCGLRTLAAPSAASSAMHHLRGTVNGIRTIGTRQCLLWPCMPTCRALPKLHMHSDMQIIHAPLIRTFTALAHLPTYLPQDPGRHVPPMPGGCPQGSAMTQLGPCCRPRRHCRRPPVLRQLPRISCFSPRPRGGPPSGLPPADPWAAECLVNIGGMLGRELVQEQCVKVGWYGGNSDQTAFGASRSSPPSSRGRWGHSRGRGVFTGRWGRSIS